MKRTRFLLWLVAGPFAILACILAVAHPYLSITRLSGGDVLVVEGWLPQEQLKQAVEIARKGHYVRVYTTGSVRPSSYYLRLNETIELHLTQRSSVPLKLNVSGTTGAGFLLSADSTKLLDERVQARGNTYQVSVPSGATIVRITATNEHAMDRNENCIFIKRIIINGKDAHRSSDSLFIADGDGHLQPGWPTYAHEARARVIALGLPPQQVTAWGRPDSRSWANANYFNVQAQQDGITAFDIVTLGVHARRSMQLFQSACGDEVKVGVISLPDPLCPRRGWWRSTVGWYRMLKEIVGSPEAFAAELSQ
jgi:uncharacterized SAM-binding protein YcdF (DUF218 family)